MNDNEKLLRLVIKHSLDEKKSRLTEGPLLDPTVPLAKAEDFEKLITPFAQGGKILTGQLQSAISSIKNFFQNNMNIYTEEELEIINNKYKQQQKGLNSLIEKEFAGLTKDSNFDAFTFLTNPALFFGNAVTSVSEFRERFPKYDLNDAEIEELGNLALTGKTEPDSDAQRVFKFYGIQKNWPTLKEKQGKKIKSSFEKIIEKAAFTQSAFDDFTVELFGKKISIDETLGSSPGVEGKRLLRKKILIDALKKAGILSEELAKAFNDENEQKIMDLAERGIE